MKAPIKVIVAPEKSANAAGLKTAVTEIDPPTPSARECLIEVHASGVNPSDVKALLGKMPGLVWPRIPGRDFAGVVAEGPTDWVGKEVWGTGGDLGMSRNGNHGQFAVIDAAALREKPANLSMHEAGSLGVSWTCAHMGMILGAAVQAGETVAVLGANGAVGQASVQLATAAGARVIAVERSRDAYAGHASGPVEVVNLATEPDLRAAILDRTEGRGADIIMNSVGDPYFETAQHCLAKWGRQIIIATFADTVPLDLRQFYRGNLRLVGVSNLEVDHRGSADILEALRAGFESGTYRPYAINDDCIFGLATANEGYKIVLEDTRRDRVVIDPRR